LDLIGAADYFIDDIAEITLFKVQNQVDLDFFEDDFSGKMISKDFELIFFN